MPRDEHLTQDNSAAASGQPWPDAQYRAAMAWVTTGDEQPDLPNILKSHSANREGSAGTLLCTER